MGTRGAIGKPMADGWISRYHHWDSYPTGLGLTLITAKDLFFGGDLDAMIKKLKVYAGAEHPHAGTQPAPLDVAAMNRKNKVGA